MIFQEVLIKDKTQIEELSAMATEIVREHYDPILGTEQNDYMLEMFQSVEAITGQLENGYRYYIVKEESRNIGFMAFYPRDDKMYLSKFYLYKEERGHGYSKAMIEMIKEEAKKENLTGIELNVNKYNSALEAYKHLGLKIVREEKNAIGNGYYMDDYVCGMEF